MVLSLGSAMSTWSGLQEDDIKATSQFKNPLHPIQKWWQLELLQLVFHSNILSLEEFFLCLSQSLGIDSESEWDQSLGGSRSCGSILSSENPLRRPRSVDGLLGFV